MNIERPDRPNSPNLEDVPEPSPERSSRPESSESAAAPGGDNAVGAKESLGAGAPPEEAAAGGPGESGVAAGEPSAPADNADADKQNLPAGAAASQDDSLVNTAEAWGAPEPSSQSPAEPAPVQRPSRPKKKISWKFLTIRCWRWARWGLCFPFAYYLGLFLATTFQRVNFPFELEWFEGHLAVQASRVAYGMPQYPDPATGWATYSYPPVYFWVVGGLFKLFGFQMFWGRLVSLLSTLLAAAGAGMIIYDHTRKRLPAVLGGLMLFIYFRPSGFWFDLFRVDMIAEAILNWGVYFALRKHVKPWQAILGLALLFLAPLAKQTVAPVSAAVFVIAFVRYWRVSRFLLVGGLIFAINATLLLPKFTKETEERWTWIYRYLLDNPQRHPFYWNRVHPEGVRHEDIPTRLAREKMSFVKEYVAKFKKQPPEVARAFYKYLIIPLALTLVWILFALVCLQRLRGGMWLLFSAFLLYGSLTSWCMIGGFSNNFIPGFAAACVLFGLAAGNIEGLLRSRWMRAVFDVILFAVLWFGVFKTEDYRFRIEDQVQTPDAAARGREWVEWIRKQKEPVYVPHHIYLMQLAGKPIDYSVDAVRDLNYCGYPTPQSLIERIRNKHYRYIILDGELQYDWMPNNLSDEIRKAYKKIPAPVQYKEGREMLPVTGALMRPMTLFEPN